jgi:hypothetical protein
VTKAPIAVAAAAVFSKSSVYIYIYIYTHIYITPWPLVRERTIPTERPPLVDEI